MKKWIHSVIAVLLASICLLPSAAFAADNTDTVPEGGYIAADPTEDDVIFTQEDLLTALYLAGAVDVCRNMR